MSDFWGNVVASVVAVIVTGTSVWIANDRRITRLETQLNNGIKDTLTEIKTSLARLFERWERLPCEAEQVRIENLESTAKTNKQRIEDLALAMAAQPCKEHDSLLKVIAAQYRGHEIKNYARPREEGAGN